MFRRVNEMFFFLIIFLSINFPVNKTNPKNCTFDISVQTNDVKWDNQKKKTAAELNFFFIVDNMRHYIKKKD